MVRLLTKKSPKKEIYEFGNFQLLGEAAFLAKETGQELVIPILKKVIGTGAFPLDQLKGINFKILDAPHIKKESIEGILEYKKNQADRLPTRKSTITDIFEEYVGWPPRLLYEELKLKNKKGETLSYPAFYKHYIRHKRRMSDADNPITANNQKNEPAVANAKN